jgi:tRNA 2-thiouridine synthesizing protein A
MGLSDTSVSKLPQQACICYATPLDNNTYASSLFMKITQIIDAQGLTCPLPLLKAKQGLHQIALGQCVLVMATDAGSVRDFHAFTELSAHKMIEFVDEQTHYRYVIEKG